MLLQERQRAWWRIASRGDAGVDVADPLPGGYEVFQIKSFTGSLTSRRKMDIKRSYERVKAGGTLNRPIVAWRLLVPMGPTTESERWFEELTAGAPFDCEWLGLGRVELLASNNQHVIDYYIRDGRERIEQRFRDLLLMRHIMDSAATGPRPVEITDGLRQLLEALNREDPHYRYAFEASHDRPPTETERARPGLVMSTTQCEGTRGCVTIRVFAKHRHAVEERPITISFGVESEGPASHLVRQAIDFGAETELEDGTVRNLIVNAPGGLSTTSDEAGMRIIGARDETFLPFRLRLSVEGPTVPRLPRRQSLPSNDD